MELLRIVAMFFIAVFHICLYILLKYEAQYPIVKPLYTLSHIGVILFVLISGYFGIKPSLRGLAVIYFSLLFYNVALYLGWVTIGGNEISVKDIAKLFLPFSHSAPYLWFIRTYVFLYLISPLLNQARDFGGPNATLTLRSTNMMILICLGIIVFWFGWIHCNSDLYDGRNIVEFSFIYLLGAFFKDRIAVTDENRRRLRRIFLLSYLALCLAVGAALYFADGAALQMARRICHPYSSPVMIAMASLLFLSFTTFSFESKAVNRIAASVLAIYLVSENRYFSFIPFYSFIEEHLLSCSGPVFAVIMLAAVIVLMGASICIDQCRVALIRFSSLRS